MYNIAIGFSALIICQSARSIYICMVDSFFKIVFASLHALPEISGMPQKYTFKAVTSHYECPQSVFLSRNEKNNVNPCKPQFYYIKVGFKG